MGDIFTGESPVPRFYLTTEEAFGLVKEIAAYVWSFSIHDLADDALKVLGDFVFYEAHDGFDDLADFFIVEAESG